MFAGVSIGNTVKCLPDLSRLQPKIDKVFDLLNLNDEEAIRKMKGSKMLERAIRGNI